MAGRAVAEGDLSFRFLFAPSSTREPVHDALNVSMAVDFPFPANDFLRRLFLSPLNLT